jgi:hypothetical protein
MFHTRLIRKILTRGSVIVTSGVLLLVSPSRFLHASDHIDSPTTAQDRGADIADVYAFLDPNDNSKLVLILSTQGFIVSGEHFGMVIFDHNIRYRFEIENTGDAKPDAFIDVTYSPGLGRLHNQTATICLPNGRRFTAPTTVANQEPQPTPPPTPVVTTDSESGVSFFAGAANDPFFLDDTGANRFVASSLMHPGHPDTSLLGERGGRDTYAGFNTLITALEVPVEMLRGSGKTIGINAVTQRHQQQYIVSGHVEGFGPYVNVDRQGNPLVNNGLIPATRKDEYNGASPEEDATGRFLASLTTDLENFGTDAPHRALILGLVQKNGDILRVDPEVPNTGPQGGSNVSGGFPNPKNGFAIGGRRLQDDVVDMVFTAINNGITLTDHVDGKPVPFSDSFPFVHEPIQPFPPGQEADDQTRQ